jgi:hypothetical protein
MTKNCKVIRRYRALDALRDFANKAENFDHFYDGMTRVIGEGEAKRLFAERYGKMLMVDQALMFWNEFRTG